MDQKTSSALVPGNSKPYALYVNWNRHDRKAKFNANWVDNRNQNWAAPVLRDCSKITGRVRYPSKSNRPLHSNTAYLC